MTPGHFLSVFLPSFFLLSAVGAPLAEPPLYREVFGSENYYLTVRYSTPPGADSARFSGSLVTAEGELPVSGQRIYDAGQWLYRVHTSAGDFEGRQSVAVQCPAFLDLNEVPEGFALERLRAGFCR